MTAQRARTGQQSSAEHDGWFDADITNDHNHVLPLDGVIPFDGATLGAPVGAHTCHRAVLPSATRRLKLPAISLQVPSETSPQMHSYDALFYDYIERGSVSSAQVIVPMLVRALGPKSVLDVGCGRGAWLSVWHQNGVTDVQGIDGDYVDRHRLLIPPSQFRAANLTQPFSLGRQFDVVQCVEVAEHLPASAAVGFVASLVAHGELVLFSAACPGQGGEHHVNEQPYSYWRDLFRRHDYLMFDWVRPEVLERTDVESWYRYNTFLFAHARKVAKLPAKIRDRQINDQAVIPDLSPFLYRLRKAILRLLPVPWVTLLAVAKHKSDIRKAARAVRTAPPSR